MLRAKKIDVFGQIILLMAMVLAAFIWSRPAFIQGCIVIGGWQVLSLLVHIIGARAMPLHVARDLFSKIMLASLAIGVAALSMNMAHYYLRVLFYVYPLIAIWYLWISNRELQVWVAKNLIHLK